MQMRIKNSWKSTGDRRLFEPTLTCGLSGLSQSVSSWPGSKSSCLIFCDNSGKKSFLFRLSRSSSSMMIWVICVEDNQGQEGYFRLAKGNMVGIGQNQHGHSKSVLKEIHFNVACIAYMLF